MGCAYWSECVSPFREYTLKETDFAQGKHFMWYLADVGFYRKHIGESIIFICPFG
jgi:hypothetical protein